jgi:aspartate kinase
MLNLQGIDSEIVILDAIVDATMASAESTTDGKGDQGVAQLGQDFYDELAQRLGERIRECGDRVPVITGMPFLLLPGLN